MRKSFKLIVASKGPLFWITGIFTIIYWSIIIGQFWRGEEFAKVPDILNEFYIATLLSYVGVNIAEKASHNGTPKEKEEKKKPGSIFVFGWVILFAVIMILVAFNVHGEEKDLSLFWPWPFGAIISIYGGSKVLNKTKEFIEKAKKMLKDNPDNPPDNPKD